MKTGAWLIAFIGVLAIESRAQNAPGIDSIQPVNDRILLKVRHTLPGAELSSGALRSTGDPVLDSRLSGIGVVELRRVFHRPARGFKDESAARAVGLDRWLVADFGRERSEADLGTVLGELSALPAVEIASREQPMILADTVPNDPDFSKQYSLQNGRLNAPKAWDIARESDHIVAVIDTGVELNHDDLIANLWLNPGEIPGNGIDDDGNGYVDDRRGWDFYYNDNVPSDRYGHGIHVAGIAGAVSDNSRQVAGVCWKVPVMAVKVFSDAGGGDHATCAAGMVYAADNGASVFNMSWGFFDSMPVLKDAVDYAHALDVVQVAAAHNYGSTTKIYPAAYYRVMGIIATDANDQKTSWSNFGSWCSMAAPGDNILNLYLNNSTAYLSGTSMSTPHVAGAAALVRAVNPSLDAVDARLVLEFSAKDLGGPGFDINYGWGRLDLLAALEKAQMLSSSTSDALPGSAVNLSLSRALEPGFVHLLLASWQARRPGISLTRFDPFDQRQIGLNEDPLLFPLVLQAGGAGIFQGFVGFLDGNGQAVTTFAVPAGASFANTAVDFAYVTLDPADLSHIKSVSNSVRVTVGQ